MHLWRCLDGIRSNKNISSIPLRDSKLTHLLLPSFLQSGLGNVVMIASVSAHVDDYEETLSILGEYKMFRSLLAYSISNCNHFSVFTL